MNENMFAQWLMSNMEASKNKPVLDTTATTVRPTEYADMKKRRDTVGVRTNEVDEFLKNRNESTRYKLGDYLSGISGLASEGSKYNGLGMGLMAGLQGVGRGLTGSYDKELERLNAINQMEQADLKNALDYDKAMGETSFEKRGYVIPGSGSSEGNITGVDKDKVGRSVGYDPVSSTWNENAITRAGATGEVGGILKYIPGMESAAASIDTKSSSATNQELADIAELINTRKILDFVGEAGSVRVADTEAEREGILGPLAQAKRLPQYQRKKLIDSSRNAFVNLGLQKARKNGVRVSAQELKDYYNSQWSVPDQFSSETTYNISDTPQGIQRQSNSPIPAAGEIRNGYRFLGGNPNDRNNWEAQ